MKPQAPYYESRFIRANDPDRARALWMRSTVLLPSAGAPVADSWVMLFDPDASGNRALKRPHPIDQSVYQYDTWTARIGTTTIDDWSARGSVSAADRSAQWDLRITPGAAAPVKLLTDRGYKAKFPTAKTMVRDPLARFDGSVELDDARFEVGRLDRQREPQLGPTAHARLRVRTGVRVRRRAGVEPGDRDRPRGRRPRLAARRHTSGVTP